jgi:catechol 2,3-dioxygenase-like lactoylglutathione lyase family enzyme
MKAQPMIVVADVEASSRWYQRVLGMRSAHGGDEYEQLTSDGDLVLQLHHDDQEEHPLLVSGPCTGIALWFEDQRFDDTLGRIVAADAEIAEGPMVNPLAHHREVWLHDPDGHLIVVSSPFGDVGD